MSEGVVGDGLFSYPYYVQRITASTQHLDAEEFGSYQRLLNHQWSTGSVPDDEERLARIAGCARPFAEVWELLEHKFPVNGDGARRNPVMEEIRAEVLERRNKRSAAGKEGARARWQSHSDRNATAMPSKAKAKAKPKEKARRDARAREAPLPAALDTPRFREVWADWEAHRKAIRKKLTPRARELQLARLEKVGEEVAIAALQLSIENGYTGVDPEWLENRKARPGSATRLSPYEQELAAQAAEYRRLNPS